MSLFDLEGTSKYVFGKNIICDVLSSYLTFAFVVIVVVQWSYSLCYTRADVNTNFVGDA